jgi:hypothetical protein
MKDVAELVLREPRKPERWLRDGEVAENCIKRIGHPTTQAFSVDGLRIRKVSAPGPDPLFLVQSLSGFRICFANFLDGAQRWDCEVARTLVQ